MINNLFYSIAAHKSNNVIDELLSNLISSEYVPAQDKKIAEHCLEVSKHGNYPAVDYFTTFYDSPAFTYNSLAEIVLYSKKVIDFYEKQYLQKQVLKSINDSDSAASLRSALSNLSELPSDTSEFDLSGFKPILYSQDDKPETKGIMCGIKEIDDETNGFQNGCIASICAFTGQGKSTFTVSTLFKNAYEGKKCVLVSLEMAPEIIWSQFQARYLYQVKGIQVSSQDILMHKLPSDVVKQVNECDEDFRNEVCSNLLIVDESIFNKKIVTDPKKMTALFRAFEKTLGGLDFVAFDHVGQFELLYPEQGNQILKAIQSTIKTYHTEDGHQPACLWCVQCNREGNKRASKHDGVYDLQSIADLNEVERSSTYIIFMYTSDDMKISQETKVTLSKHRLGGVISEPVVTTFNPAVATVGSTIEQISMTADDFNSLDDVFGEGSFDDAF